METYLWIEDRKGKSGYVFWETFMKQVCPKVIVESKKNNSELVKAVKEIEDQENKYIIVLDNAFDNLQVMMEKKRLRDVTTTKDNIAVIEIICFEYILLEFNELIEWIYAAGDEFLVKRRKAINARRKLVNTIKNGELNYKDIREIIEYDEHIDSYNVEQLSAKLLFDLTRNTGFEVSKGSIGECWIKSCCEWAQRQPDDLCGLDDRRLQLREKMQCICRKTGLLRQLQDIGLEVAV